MKKLEAINFNECDELSDNHMSAILGGSNQRDVSTHQSIEHQPTDLCAGGDMAYCITWDCGNTSTGAWSFLEVDPE